MKRTYKLHDFLKFLLVGDVKGQNPTRSRAEIAFVIFLCQSVFESSLSRGQIKLHRMAHQNDNWWCIRWKIFVVCLSLIAKAHLVGHPPVGLHLSC